MNLLILFFLYFKCNIFIKVKLSYAGTYYYYYYYYYYIGSAQVSVDNTSVLQTAAVI